MNNFISQCIEGLIFFAIIFFAYRNPKAPAVVKSKGFMFLMLIGFLCFSYKIYDAYRYSNLFPSATVNQIKEKIASNGTFVKEDLVYNSPDGYTVLIPKEYSFIVNPLGMVRLIATNKENSELMIGKSLENFTLEQNMQSVRDAYQKSNSSYSSSENMPVRINNIEGLRADFQITRNNIPLRSAVIFLKKNDGMYSIMLVCREELFDGMKIEEERILNSFK